MQATTIGIDLAKNVFQVHGVDAHGKKIFNKALKRERMATFFVNLPPALVGMEACGSAFHWARKLQTMGHTVRLMAPQFVKPYVKGNKHDAADAEAIVRPSLAPPLCAHQERGAAGGAVDAQGASRLCSCPHSTGQSDPGPAFRVRPDRSAGHSAHHRTRTHLIEDATNDLPGSFRILIDRLLEHFKALQAQIQQLEAQILAWHRSNPASKRLEHIPGIGPITASALIASLGDARSFKDGRQVAAWLGLVPKQHSSGGKQNLLGISKRGDTYLRTLLIQGARSVVYHADQPNLETASATCQWIRGVAQRRNKNIAAVALANKNARICWALLVETRTTKSEAKQSAYEELDVASTSGDPAAQEKNHRLLRQSCSDGKTG
jgi:transposase